MVSTCINNATKTLPFLSDLNSEPNQDDFIDFEFHPNHTDTMLTADKLFFAGKLLPLQLPEPSVRETPSKPLTKLDLIGSASNHFAGTPKALTCSTRWHDLLRLKRQSQSANSDPKSNRPHYLPRHLFASDPKSDPDHAAIPSRLSLSSSSSSGRLSDADDQHLVPRLSLGLDPIPRKRVPGLRMNALADSPRMNASGKVVFNGLGRSSSSPSTCGARAKQHGRGSMERSYSGNVRVTPVLNVPLCSFRAGSKSFGFGQLFSGSGSKSKSNKK